MANQMTAVTGRRLKPNYVAAINEQSMYLPTLKRVQKEDELAQRALDLQQSELTLSEENMLRNEALEREQLEEAKKQARIGNLISVGNLGLKTGMGVYGIMDDEKKEGAKKAVGGLLGKTGTSVESGAEAPANYFDFKSSPDFLSSEGAGSWGNWGEALGGYEPWAGAGIGSLAAKTIGKDKSTGTKALIGGAAGGLASGIMSGFDPYKTIIGGLLGGFGGGLL